MKNSLTPKVGFAAFSGAGKTSLLEKLIHHFAKQNLHVAIIKHAHHQFDIDKEGKDSFRHRKAGAKQVLISSARRCAHIIEHDEEPSLQQLITRLELADIIFVEGFKQERIPKIEIHRPELGQEILAQHDADIIAIASPNAEIVVAGKTSLDLNDTKMIADFITENFQIVKRQGIG